MASVPFVVAGALLAGGGVPAVAVFIGGAMLLGIGVIAVWGPSTSGLALEQVSVGQTRSSARFGRQSVG